MQKVHKHIYCFFVHFLLIVTQTIWKLSRPFGNFTQHPKTFQHDFKDNAQKLSGCAKNFQVEYQPVTQVFGRLVWSPDHLYGKSSRTYFCILYSEKQRTQNAPRKKYFSLHSSLMAKLTGKFSGAEGRKSAAAGGERQNLQMK